MKVLGRAASSARNDLTDGSVKAAWHRVLLAAVVATSLVFGGLIAESQADPVPFAPTVTFTTSTKQAAAHPDAKITITSVSDEKLKSATIDLPNGFWGSLAAVDKCAYATAAAGNCTSAAQVGTVTASARVDNSDVVLQGQIYMTAPHPDFASVDPAWLSVKINPDIQGVTSFDPIITPARVTARYLTFGAKKGQPTGIRTQIGNIAGHPEFDVPTEVTDTSSTPRTIDFTLRKISVDLKSDLNPTPPKQPLLTNPSSCASGYNFTASFVGHANTAPAATNIPYQATGCSNTKFRPKSSVSLATPTAGSLTGLTGSIEFPAGSAGVAESKITLPASWKVNIPGLDHPSMCAPTTAYQPLASNPVQWFDPAACPAGGVAVLGTAEIETPLLPDPLKANVYMGDNGSTPNLIIYADQTTGAGNPAGISLPIIMRSSAVDAAVCPSTYTTCPETNTSLVSTIVKLPDAPVTKVTFDLAKPNGWRPGGLSTKLLEVFQAGDPQCRPNGAVTAEFKSQTGATAASSSLQPITGCSYAPPAAITLGSTYAEQNPTSTSPAIPFSPTPTDCVFGSADAYDDDCTSPTAPASPLSPGVNVFSLSDVGDLFTPGDYRVFTVQNPPSLPETDTTAPVVNIDTPVSSPTSDTTPSISFSATGSSTEFQCALNDGAFLPCGTGASGSYTVPSEDALIPMNGEKTYNIKVRAQDAAGNVSAPQTSSFEVNVPLDPTFDVSLSTTEARKHPSMDVTITSGSHEDLKDLSLSLPDGFLGGLTGVPTLCPIATANAGNCTAASQAGTVETEAIVDQSTIRLPGKVYLTEPIQVGDPAGIYVDIPAKLQDVDMGHVLVPIRLSVRGQVKGIDSLATNLPTGIDPNNGIDGHSDFDLRSITLKLRDNPSASQPLLTNPSQCGAGSFAASFKGVANTEVSKSVAFQATNCGALGFGPQLSMSLIDSKTGQPPVESTNINLIVGTFDATLTADPSQAGIKATTVLLPLPVTVNIAKLPTKCLLTQYNNGGAAACPASSIVGTVTAASPLLNTPLSGNIYLVESSDPAITLPRLMLALRGAINTDILGTMKFRNGSQIETSFSDLPDAPLSSVHLRVNSVISTRPEACSYTDAQRIAQTSFTAFNGLAASTAQTLPITCAGSGEAKFKNKGKKSTLSLDLRAPEGTKFKSVTVKLPSGLKFVKKGFKKGFMLKSGTKKLKYSCAKVSKSNKLTVGLCKKYNQFIAMKYAAGTLTATKKVKKPKITVDAVDNLNRKYTFVVQSK